MFIIRMHDSRQSLGYKIKIKNKEIFILDIIWVLLTSGERNYTSFGLIFSLKGSTVNGVRSSTNPRNVNILGLFFSICSYCLKAFANPQLSNKCC